MLTTIADCTNVVTVYPEGHSGIKATRAKKATVSRETKPKGPTNEELRAKVAALGLKATTKHVKAELLAMLKTKVQVRAAAQDRDNAKRKAAHAIAAAAK